LYSRALLAAAATASVILAATAVVNLAYVAQYRSEVRSEVIQQAGLVRARLEGALNARLHLTYGLGAYARVDGTVDEAQFQKFAAALELSGLTGVRSLQLAPDAVVRHVYPRQGNEAIIGHDLLNDPRRREAVQQTIDDRLFKVIGPIRLIQGGAGLIARLPLYMNRGTGGGQEDFWGFATVVLDAPPILREGGLYEPDLPLSIALRGKDGLGAGGQGFFGDMTLFEPEAEAVLLRVGLPHGWWQLAAVPRGGWPQGGVLTPYIWGGGGLLALLAAWFVYGISMVPVRLRAEIARATANLRDAEERFSRVAESATDAIMSADAAGRLVFANPTARQLFCLPEHVAEGTAGPSIETLLDAHGHRLADLPDGVVITMTGTCGGQQVPLEVSLSSWRWQGQQFRTFIVRDARERLRAEEERAQLRERQYQVRKLRAVSTLASGAAHEFSNLLNSALANAEVAVAELPEDSDAGAAVAAAIEANWRAADVVRKLLAFADDQDRTQSGAPVDIAELVQARLATFSADVGRDVPLVRDGDGAMMVRGDVERLDALVDALLRNAYDAVGATGGAMEVTLTPFDLRPHEAVPDMTDMPSVSLGDIGPGRYGVLKVRDDGEGIDRDALDQVFEPFFTTRAPGEGVGLGLFTVSAVVLGLGGLVRIGSAVGRGTEVEVWLPCTSTEAPQPA